MTFHLGLAKDHDCRLIIRMVDQAAAWLRNKDTDQWAKPWPSRAARDARILAAITQGKTWIARDGDTPAATITSEDMADQALAGEWNDGEPAVYVRRLVVARTYGGCGLGSRLLSWAGDHAAERYGARWVRIDVWKTNKALHKYYVDQGFDLVAYCRDTEYPSGALFQRTTNGISVAEFDMADDTATSSLARQKGSRIAWRASYTPADRVTCPCPR